MTMWMMQTRFGLGFMEMRMLYKKGTIQTVASRKDRTEETSRIRGRLSFTSSDSIKENIGPSKTRYIKQIIVLLTTIGRYGRVVKARDCYTS